ncbi:MAG: DUF3253 domain-containing protein [Pseudomonadota bacterium]
MTEAEAILRLLQERRPGASICPSEAARRVAAAAGESEWRPRMAPVRAAAAALAASGRIAVTQRGRPVAIATARGPVRLSLAGKAG